MTDQKMQDYRRQLLKLQGELIGDADALEDEALDETRGNLSGIPVEDRSDRGFDDASEELMSALTDNAAVRSREIRDALGRIEEGTFGHCADCGREIAAGRLQSTPYVSQCIECARVAQRDEGVPAGNL